MYALVRWNGETKEEATTVWCIKIDSSVRGTYLGQSTKEKRKLDEGQQNFKMGPLKTVSGFRTVTDDAEHVVAGQTTIELKAKEDEKAFESRRRDHQIPAEQSQTIEAKKGDGPVALSLI